MNPGIARLLVLLPALLAYGCTLLAQQAGIEMLTTREGLSQGYICNIFQDSEGFIWVGTKNGLNRYDGYRFEEFTFDPYDEHSLGHDYINTISERGEFLILGANKGGLNLLHKKTRKVFRIPFNQLVGSSENEDGAIFWTEFDAYGNLWVQVNRPDLGNYLAKITFPEGFFGKHPENANWLKALKIWGWPRWVFGIPCLSADKKNIFIPDEDNAIHQLEIHSGHSSPLISNSPTKFGAWLYLDHRGNILINCILDKNPALFRLTLGKTPALKQLPVPEGFIDYRQITGDSLIWLQTKQGCSAYRLDKAGNFDPTRPEVENIPVPSGLSWMMQDRSEIIWMGTNGLGIVKFNPRAVFFRHLLKGQSVSAPILRDRHGNIYTADSENRLLISVEKPQVQSNYFPQAAHRFWPNGRICMDQQGTLWVAGISEEKQSEYLVKVTDRNPPRYFPLPSSDLHPRDLILALTTDKTGKIWMAYGGNLVCFDPVSEQVQSHYYTHLVAKGHNVNAILPTADGSWWIATNEGLVRGLPAPQGFNFQIFKTNLADRNSLRSNNVASLLADPVNPEVLWIGTKGGGLNRLDTRTMAFTHLTKSEGLPNNVIYAVLNDEDGNLWMSSNKGLIRYSPSSGEIKNYTDADGVQDNEFNTWAYGKGTNGELFFGGVNGITAFHPRDLKENTMVPQVCINGLRLNDEPARGGRPGDVLQQAVEFTQAIVVPYSKNNITLEFVALDFSVSGKNRFRYYLEGAEEAWRHESNDHQATYLNLAPGTYAFKVIGSNSDGVWNSMPVSLEITVLPPWYRTWWAWLLYALTVGGVIYQFYRYQLRNKLEHAETLRLKELDAFKSNFFTNISHDLRTPLTLILSPLKRLLKNGQFAPEETRQLHLMAQSGEQLKERIEEILALSRLEAGKLDLQETALELHSFLSRIVGNFESHARQTGIELQFDYQAPQPCYLLLDRNKLEKMLNNLLGNAHKFTPAGGKVMLAATTESFSNGPKTTALQFLTLKVSDTGRGIPLEDQPQVFNRYFQTSQKQAVAEGGTGIGLAIVREFTELMGGQVSLQSAPGEGSIFTVQLPFRLAEFGANPEAEEEEPEVLADLAAPLKATAPVSHNRTSVLVVEDNHALREYLDMILKPHYEVKTAANGRIAWEYCQQPDFNCQLILSDIMMPEMDGFALLEKIKSYSPTRLLPFIFLTARAGMEDRISAMRIGVDDYLLKPFDEEELLARVANLLHNYQERTAVAVVSETSAPFEPELEQAADASELWVERLRTYTLENLSNPTFSVQQLTEAAGMGHSTFNEKMKQETGLTPNLFVREIRLIHARTLLETRACGSVQDVCRTVGFQKTAYFSQLFKERFGKNPSEYLEF